MNNIDSINKRRTTISISESLRNDIAQLGHIGTTYEEVLTPLVKSAKAMHIPKTEVTN